MKVFHYSFYVWQVLVLESLLQWAGVIDELKFAERLSQWCQSGFPELGDKTGFDLSNTIKKVCKTLMLRFLLIECIIV